MSLSTNTKTVSRVSGTDLYLMLDDDFNCFDGVFIDNQITWSPITQEQYFAIIKHCEPA